MDIDECLIKEIRKRPLIYDSAHSDYKNAKIKEGAWNEVARNIKLDEAQCKKRWKGLRDTYKRCRRAEQTSSGSVGIPKRRWRYTDMMTFLDNVKSNKPIERITDSPENVLVDDCNHSDSADSIYIVQTTASADSVFIQTTASETPMPSTTPSMTPIITPSMTPSITQNTTPCIAPSPPVRKKNSREKFGEFLDLAANSISQTCAAFVEQQKNQDSTALHFASLAIKLREANLPINVVNQIEAKVSELVFAEIEKHQCVVDCKPEPDESSVIEQQTLEWTDQNERGSPKREIITFENDC